MRRSELKSLARARLEDAAALLAAGRHDAAFYLCGYAVEVALKARVCQKLGWDEYQITKPFQGFKTHELDFLLALSGTEKVVTSTYDAEWCISRHGSPVCVTVQLAP